MMKTTLEVSRSPDRLMRWQWATVALMVAGYAGYYLCRSNLSVCIPLIRDDLVRQGFSADAAKQRLGMVVSFGILAYAVGKFFAGGLADFQGGRRNYLGGMIGSIGFTILFALGGSIPLFTLASVGNRFVQSFGWAGMIKITSRWFPHGSYGRVMAFISLSFLFGDALARKFMGYLLGLGYSWQQVFFACAATMFVLLVINMILLKETPRQIGEEEPVSHADSLFGEQGNEPVPPGVWALLRPLFRRRVFWYVCMLSLGLTLLRETFNTWIPTYFNEALGMSQRRGRRQELVVPLPRRHLGAAGRVSERSPGPVEPGADHRRLPVADDSGTRFFGTPGIWRRHPLAGAGGHADRFLADRSLFLSCRGNLARLRR